MKKKTTMNYIINGFTKVYRCGYCDLCDIVTREADYYNCGLYGWNCDIYIDYEHDTAITTGYRNMRGERIPEKILAKYQEEGRTLREDYYNPNKFILKKNLEKRFYAELAGDFQELSRLTLLKWEIEHRDDKNKVTA